MKIKEYILPLRKVRLPRLLEVTKYFEKIDENLIYSNNGPLVRQLREALAQKYNLDTGLITITSSGTKSLQTILQRIVNHQRRGKTFKGTHSEELYCILPSYTFVASAMAIIGAGLRPIFVDIEEKTGQLSTLSVERFLNDERVERSKIIAVMPVSPFGAKINKEIWAKFTAKYELELVYDEAWCFDSFVPDKKGASALSLHATKSFGCGEGGVIFSKNYEDAVQYQRIINFGLDDKRESQCIGTNGKMSEYHAAVALASLDRWSGKRNICLGLQGYYLEKLRSFSSIRPLDGFDDSWSWGSLPIIFKKEHNLKHVIEAAKSEKIEMRSWWNGGIHRFPSMKEYPRDNLENTRVLSNKLINIPFFPEMQEQDIDIVCKFLEKFDS